MGHSWTAVAAVPSLDRELSCIGPIMVGINALTSLAYNGSNFNQNLLSLW